MKLLVWDYLDYSPLPWDNNYTVHTLLCLTVHSLFCLTVPISILHSLFLHSAIQTFLQHPKLASAQANRNFVVSSMTEALGAIADLTDGLEPAAIPFLLAVEGGSSSKLYQHFDEFEVNGSILQH